MAFNYDSIGDLFVPLRQINPTVIPALEAIRSDVTAIEDGKVYTLPPLASPFGFELQETLTQYGPDMEPNRREVLRDLVTLSGQACVVRLHQNQRFLLGRSVSIPEDMAPVIILDASGRVRQTYALWEHHRGNLVRLRSAAKDYSGLTIHHWSKGGGRATVQEGMSAYADAVAMAINTRLDEEWLVIHHKPKTDTPDFESAVLSRLEGDQGRVKFLTWGRHHGTNDFADIPNVVLVGALYYREMDYEARWHACTDIAPDQQRCSDEERALVEEGEFRHMALQALCRIAVRKNHGGACPPCTAYVIAKKGNVVSNLTQTFPGARIVPWHPKTVELTGRLRKAMDIVEEWLDAPSPEPLLRFITIADRLDMHPRTLRDNIRLHPQFIARLADLGVVEAGGGGRRKTGYARIPSDSPEPEAA